MFLFNAISVLALIPPPILAFFAWQSFLGKTERAGSPKRRFVVERVAIVAVPGFPVTGLAAFLVVTGNEDGAGWDCVARWRWLSAVAIRLTPVFSLLWRKGTRIVSFLLPIAVKYEC